MGSEPDFSRCRADFSLAKAGVNHGLGVLAHMVSYFEGSVFVKKRGECGL